MFLILFLCFILLSLFVVCSTLHEVTSFVYILVITSSSKEDPLHTFVTFSASLPQFQRPFSMISIPKSRDLVDASHEESLDQARS